MILPVSSAQAARCAARHAISTPRRTFTCCSFPSWSWTAAVTTAGGEHQTFAIRDHQQLIRLWRHQVPNRAAPPRRRGPRPPPRSTGKVSTTAAPIAIAAVTDERRSPMNLRGRPDPTGSISTSLSMNITADEPRWPATLIDQMVQDVDGGIGVDPAVHGDGQGFAGVLVHDVEQLQDPSIEGLVELVVQRPHVR